MLQKKPVIIGLAVAAIVILIPVILLVMNQSKQSQVIEQEKPLVGVDHVDPVSGETYTTSTRQHDSGEKAINMLGFSQLIDAGLGMDQYGQFEQKISLLSSKLPEQATTISMYKGSAENTYEDRGESRIRMFNFKMQINQKDDYAASIEYTSLDDMTLKIYNADRTKLLYTL